MNLNAIVVLRNHLIAPADCEFFGVVELRCAVVLVLVTSFIVTPSCDPVAVSVDMNVADALRA